MTPAEVKANLERFNEASALAAKAKADLDEYSAANPLADELVAILTRWIDAAAVMIETSSELIDLDAVLRKAAKA